MCDNWIGICTPAAFHFLQSHDNAQQLFDVPQKQKRHPQNILAPQTPANVHHDQRY